MPTGGWDGSVRVYEEDDKVDEKLLNQLSKWILYNRLPWLARNLGFTQAEIFRIVMQFPDPEERIFQFLYRWHIRSNVSMRELVQSMVMWHQNRCLDPEVWERFLRHHLDPALMPAPSELQLCTDQPDGQLPARDTEHRMDDGEQRPPYIVELPDDQDEVPVETSPDDELTREDQGKYSVTSVKFSKACFTQHQIIGKPQFMLYPKCDTAETQNLESVCEITSSDVNGGTEVMTMTGTEMLDLQQRLKDSLDRTWKNSLCHDWIPVEKAKTFPLREFYVGLRWVRAVKRAIRNFQHELASIYDIFNIEDTNDQPKATNILVTAGPGMGKTSSMAKLALDWNPDAPINSNPVNKFDFVFLLRLRYVDKISSLAGLIVAQHGKLKPQDTANIAAILEGKTSHRVLLMLDGYDEYKPGTNAEIDRAIEHSIGNCFLILTSRPDLPSRNGHYVSQEIRNQMDGEVIIEGFNEDNIMKCSVKYLENEESAVTMISQAKEVGIYDLLKIPIVVLMTCVIYFEQKSLPETRTKIYSNIFEMIIERTALKTFKPGLYADVKDCLDDLLCALGELSWNALQNDVQQLLLNKDEIEKKSPILMKLGLLFENGFDETTHRESPTFFTFQHKSFHDYTSSLFIRKQLEKTDDKKKYLKDLFPSWYHVKRYEEVLIFTCGLMSDPRLLIEHVEEMLVERETLLIRVGDDQKELTHLRTMGKSPLLLNLIRSLYAQTNMPLEGNPHHNEMFHFYSHQQDDLCGRARDITPIEIPSQLYAFLYLEESLLPCNINWDFKAGRSCIIMINGISPLVANSVLLTCREISQNQPITDLLVQRLHCDTSQVFPADVFNLCKTAQSITIANSTLPRDLMENLINQLPKCKCLRKLHFKNILLYNPPSNETSEEQINDTKLSDASSKTQNQVSKWRFEFQFSNQSQGNCLLSGDAFSFLSKCTMLTHLNLNGSKVGKAGVHIVEIIDCLGLDSPLKLLYLRDCAIPPNICKEILKSLKKCKQLTHLDIGGHTLDNDADHLVELIKSFRVDPILQQLHLQNCSMPEEKCTEILKYLSKYKHLTHLNLSGNRVGKAGIHIVEILVRKRLVSPLKLLCLRDCSIPNDTMQEILKCLKNCNQLTDLDLGGHNLGNAGDHLVEIIKNFGVDPPLEQLYLQNCLVCQMEMSEIINDYSRQARGILRTLDKCKNLIYISLEGNTLTGQLSNFLPDPDSTLPSLRHLKLTNVGLNKDDVNHLKTLLECGRMSALAGLDDTDALWLDRNNLGKLVDELEGFLNACLNEHQMQLKITLFHNNLSDEFVEKWTKRCAGTHVKLFF